MELAATPFLRGALVRVQGRPGTWTVVRDTGSKLIVIRRGLTTTSTPRTHVTQAKGKAA